MTEDAPVNSLGHFRPLAQLGQGGMARVLLVSRDGPAGIQKLLVVKEIREEFANDAEFVTMFMDEARLATRMNHPNLVQTYEVGAEGGRYFMLMEFLEGQPMHAVLGRLKRQLPLATHLHVLGRVLAGLHYAHDLCGFDGQPLMVVHRDVSPQNVILCYDGHVKVFDFGIAKAAGAIAKTSTGVFKGKLGYVAPEQVAGDEVDRRADIFSVGVMLWEALVGRRLTYGENEAGVLYKRTSGLQARVLQARPEADPELAAICDKAMELDKNKRFATALEMHDAIDARMHALGLRATDSDVAKLVTGAFADERAGIRALVERQLSLPARTAADRSAVAKLPTVANDSGPQSIPPPSLGGPQPQSTSTPPIVGTSTSMSVSRPFRTPRRTIVLVGSIVGGLGLVLLAIATLASHATGVRSTPSLPGVGTSVTAASQSATPAVASVDVSVDAVPARAKIAIDGKSVGRSPFRGAFTKDGSQHELVVSADGFASETRSIILDRDVRLEIALKPGTTRPTPTSSQPAAGTELQVGPRAHHIIDEKDPYQ